MSGGRGGGGGDKGAIKNQYDSYRRTVCIGSNDWVASPVVPAVDGQCKGMNSSESLLWVALVPTYPYMRVARMQRARV
jgi:hypothetical protein